MAYIYLRGRAAESWPKGSLAGKRSVRSKKTPIAKPSSWPDKLTAFWNTSRYGTSANHLTEPYGVGRSITLPPGFLASRSQMPANEKGKTMSVICGLKPSESSENREHGQLSWKMLEGFSQTTISEPFSKTWKRLVSTPQGRKLLRRLVWAHTSKGKGSGLLPTPTASCYRGSSKGVKKFQKKRRSQIQYALHALFGMEHKTAYPNPRFLELVMDWPLGWTELKPLGMDSFQEWFSRH